MSSTLPYDVLKVVDDETGTDILAEAADRYEPLAPREEFVDLVGDAAESTLTQGQRARLAEMGHGRFAVERTDERVEAVAHHLVGGRNFEEVFYQGVGREPDGNNLEEARVLARRLPETDFDQFLSMRGHE